MKTSCIGIAAFMTALLAALVISPPITVALAGVPATAPVSRPASAPAVRQSAGLPVGTLMPVAEIVLDTVSQSGFGYQGAASLYSSDFVSAPAGCGVVNPRAVVCKRNERSFKQWSAAMDSLKPDDRAVNVLRLDLTGKDQFQNATVVPLKRMGSTSYEIDHVAVNLEWNGKTVPAMVRGYYTRSATNSRVAAGSDQVGAAPLNRNLNMFIGRAMAGRCRFGDKVYAVKLADANGNLILGEPVQLLGYSRGAMRARGNGGDSVAVLAQDGSRISRAMLGHPVLVDGVWYDLTVAPDGTTMEAAGRTGPTGTVVIDVDKWSAILVHGTTSFCISGGRRGVKLPAGEYDIACYQQKDEKGAISKDICNSLTIPAYSETKPETRRIKVEEGQTLALKIGAPLTAILTCKIDSDVQGQRTLNTSLAFRDVGDREVHLIVMGMGEQVRISIKDETGKVLTSGPIGYSGDGNMGHSWRVPDDVKGPLTVELDTSKLPVNVDCPPVKVDVK